ncbi:anthranilate synthase component I family protein, partial [Micromonospora purpureochromogenes]
MRKNGPTGVETLPQPLIDVPGAPASCRSVLVERARYEWRPADGGDPAAMAEQFLAEHGLDLTDLAR